MNEGAVEVEGADNTRSLFLQMMRARVIKAKQAIEVEIEWQIYFQPSPWALGGWHEQQDSMW